MFIIILIRYHRCSILIFILSLWKCAQFTALRLDDVLFWMFLSRTKIICSHLRLWNFKNFIYLLLLKNGYSYSFSASKIENSVRQPSFSLFILLFSSYKNLKSLLFHVFWHEIRYLRNLQLSRRIFPSFSVISFLLRTHLNHYWTSQLPNTLLHFPNIIHITASRFSMS